MTACCRIQLSETHLADNCIAARAAQGLQSSESLNFLSLTSVTCKGVLTDGDYAFQLVELSSSSSSNLSTVVCLAIDMAGS